jgi:ABC-type transport system involved in cytochrome c biogenesis permease subunit
MIALHTICSLLSYMAFLVAFISGALFLIQERQLKHKHMGALFHRLPALGTLDRINFAAIGAGFGLLSVGVLFGVLGSHRLLGSWWHWDPKELLTLLLWVSYLVLWLVRLRATLRGRKIALLSILGFTLVLFTFLGVSRWLPTWHAYL